MEEKHHSFAIIGIVAIVAMAGLMMGTQVMSSNIGGEAARSEFDSVGNSKLIRAHSCDADGVCEVNTLSVDDILFEETPAGETSGSTKYLCLDEDNKIFAQLWPCEGWDMDLILHYDPQNFTVGGSEAYNLTLDGVDFFVELLGGNDEDESANLRVTRDSHTSVKNFEIGETRTMLNITFNLTDIFMSNIGSRRFAADFDIVSIE